MCSDPTSTLSTVVLVTKIYIYARVVVKRQMVMKMTAMYRAIEYPIRADVFSLLAFCTYTMLRVKCSRLLDVGPSKIRPDRATWILAKDTASYVSGSTGVTDFHSPPSSSITALIERQRI